MPARGALSLCAWRRKEDRVKPHGQLMIEHRLIEKYLANAAARIQAMPEDAYDLVMVADRYDGYE
jgi:hypothetical protein